MIAYQCRRVRRVASRNPTTWDLDTVSTKPTRDGQALPPISDPFFRSPVCPDPVLIGRWQETRRGRLPENNHEIWHLSEEAKERAFLADHKDQEAVHRARDS